MRYIVTLVLIALLSGCACVTDRAIKTAEVAAAGSDRLTDLVHKALEEKADLQRDKIASVSPQDLASSPASVQVLLQKLLNAVHAHRYAWHSVLFQLDEGVDPAKLDLEAIRLPSVNEELGDFLGDESGERGQ